MAVWQKLNTKNYLLAIRYGLQKYRWYRSLHLAYTGWRAYHRGLPDWAGLLNISHMIQRDAIRASSCDLEHILIATATAGHLPSMTFESLLGAALVLRGVAVDFLLCDGALPACMICEIRWYREVSDFTRHGPIDRCLYCHGPAARMLDDSGFQHLGLATKLSESERNEARRLAIAVACTDIHAYSVDRVAVGEHAMAGALRFYARGDFGTCAAAESLLRRYFEAALLTYFATRRLLADGRYKVVVLNHGIYVPQGVIAETARSLGVRVVTWHPAYRRQCFIFSHDETYHHSLLTEPTATWEDMPWGEKQKREIEEYLKSRWQGKQDWIRFHADPELDVEAIQRETGVDLLRPTVGLLTNVVWDAQLHYPANAFSSMLDWLLKTISYFENRPELQLLIRIHPAEITGSLPSRQLAEDEIRSRFPKLPANIFIIRPDSRLSTYVAMSRCNAVIIYGTKTGVELAATGLPVIVAGEAWIRGKGVTIDAVSEEAYYRLLDMLPLPARLDECTRDRALRYAYHFFFRRMIPVECVSERRGWPPFAVAIDDLAELLPGRSVGLDVICDGILEGTSFTYPAERLVS